MWNNLLIMIGLREIAISEIITAELYNSKVMLHNSLIEAEKWNTTVVMYTDRVKRLEDELEDHLTY